MSNKLNLLHGLDHIKQTKIVYMDNPILRMLLDMAYEGN